MTKELIDSLAGLDETCAVNAFSRILTERPDERAALVRAVRADLPDLYAKWLDQTVRPAGV